jgi:putative transposase
VHTQREYHSIAFLCEVLEVSRSGYYAWLERSPGPRAIRKEMLLDRVIEIHEESWRSYGSPRIHAQLEAEGIHCNPKTVEKLMREHEIAARRKRKYKSTTDSKHDLPIAPNVLSREFKVQEPNEVWVSDITYVETQSGWLYLAVFIDLYSRMVVGWSMSASMTAELVVDAFNMGVCKQGVPPIVVHSDRGVQYASKAFRAELESYGCIQSMSRKGNCWDNAVAESFFGALKSEHVYHHTFVNQDEATLSLFEYIEIFYNTRRIHSALNYLTPWEKGQKGKKVA